MMNPSRARHHEADEPLYGTHKLLFTVYHVGLLLVSMVSESRKTHFAHTVTWSHVVWHLLHTWMPIHLRWWICRAGKISRLLFSCRHLCSSAHESLLALFKKHPFVPTTNICVIYTTKEPGVRLPGLEQRLSASQFADKKNWFIEIKHTVLTKQRQVSWMLFSWLHPSNIFHQEKWTKGSICLWGLLERAT